VCIVKKKEYKDLDVFGIILLLISSGVSLLTFKEVEGQILFFCINLILITFSLKLRNRDNLLFLFFIGGVYIPYFFFLKISSELKIMEIGLNYIWLLVLPIILITSRYLKKYYFSVDFNEGENLNKEKRNKFLLEEREFLKELEKARREKSEEELYLSTVEIQNFDEIKILLERDELERFYSKLKEDLKKRSQINQNLYCLENGVISSIIVKNSSDCNRRTIFKIKESLEGELRYITNFGVELYIPIKIGINLVDKELVDLSRFYEESIKELKYII